MIKISKEEKDIISKRIPRACIVRTMKNDSKRHHYQCEETRRVLELLSELRGSDEVYDEE